MIVSCYFGGNVAYGIHEKYIFSIETAKLFLSIRVYDLLFEKQGEIRTLWHDLKHHFVVIGMYAKENENAKILNYLSEIDKEIIQADNIVQTGNFVIDSIINQKKQYALKNKFRSS
jgi:hypothetical protein